MLTEHVFYRYPKPDTISSDRGVHFTSRINAEFAAKMNITWKYHCGYHPESTGALEIQHRSIKDSIFIAVHATGLEWPEVLASTIHIINCQPNAGTKVSPHEAVYGLKPNLSKYDPKDPLEATSLDNYTKKQAELLAKIHKKIAECQLQADKALKKSADPKRPAKEIFVGDKVLIYRPFSVIAKRSKLKWIGPYSVTDSFGHVIVIEDSEGRTDYIHRSQCQKIEDRKPHLGPLPPFPQFNVPLRRTNFDHPRPAAQISDNLPPNMLDQEPVNPLEDNDPELETTLFETPPTSPVRPKTPPQRVVTRSQAKQIAQEERIQPSQTPVRRSVRISARPPWKPA